MRVKVLRKAWLLGEMMMMMMSLFEQKKEKSPIGREDDIFDSSIVISGIVVESFEKFDRVLLPWSWAWAWAWIWAWDGGFC